MWAAYDFFYSINKFRVMASEINVLVSEMDGLAVTRLLICRGHVYGNKM
jgi:hypothetical protein